jgi:thymidylate kinase
LEYCILEIYRNLFKSINDKGIKYCHFKSNDHIKAGLNGLTDLDIVVLPEDARKFIKILHDFDFKRTEAGFGVKNHAREGHLGYDRISGKLVYIDLHFSVIIGKNRIREYALNELSSNIIKHRVMHEESGVFIASPTYEIFLLILRASIKVRARDKIKEMLGITFFDESWTCQHDWLGKRYNQVELAQLLKFYFHEDDSNRVFKSFEAYPNLKELFYLKKKFKKSFFGSLKYGNIVSFFGMIFKEINGFLCYVNRRFFSNLLPLNRRYLASGGKFITLVGVDGAGKSTQIEFVTKYLTWKLDVSNVYLGAGDGDSSWHRSILIKGRKLLSLKSDSYNESSYEKKKSSMGLFRKLARNIWAVSLMIEKNSKLKKYHRLSKRATVVISDRYPQNNVKNFNDGVLLSEYKTERKWSLLGMLASIEDDIYSGKKYGSPDLVIKLMIEPEVSVERGQSTSISYLQRRIDTVNSMTFSESCVVVEVDASQALEKVSQDISNAIWKIL